MCRLSFEEYAGGFVMVPVLGVFDLQSTEGNTQITNPKANHDNLFLGRLKQLPVLSTFTILPLLRALLPLPTGSGTQPGYILWLTTQLDSPLSLSSADELLAQNIFVFICSNLLPCNILSLISTLL